MSAETRIEKIKQEIEAKKQEFRKKYETDRTGELLGDGYFEREVEIPKSRIVKVAGEQVEKMKDIYNILIRLLKETNHDLVYNEYQEKWEVTGTWEGIEQTGASDKTEEFLAKFKNPFEELTAYRNLIVPAYNNYYNIYAGLAKGEHGEQYVDKELEIFQKKYKYAKNIKLAHVDFKGKTSETDLYVATSKGILVCEIKNKGNEKYIFKISKDGQWTKYDGREKFLEVMDSPFAQNTRHCIATEQLLKNNGITDFKLIPVVIMANEKVRIDNDSDNSVIRISELYNFVEKLDLPEKYDEAYQQRVIDLLHKNHIQEENYFKGNVVDDEMKQATIDFTKYYLKMAYDVEILKIEIAQLEHQLAEEIVQAGLAVQKKHEQKMGAAAAGLILLAICFHSIILGIGAGFYLLFFYFYMTNDAYIAREDIHRSAAAKVDAGIY